MKFKVGDKVRCHYNDNGSNECVGMEGEITYVSSSKVSYPYNVSFSTSSLFSEKELELINNNKIMSLVKKFTLAFKKEPEKSFNKSGITDDNDILTTEGSQVFLGWLLKKFGDDFKKEVVDPILAEMEKETK